MKVLRYASFKEETKYGVKPTHNKGFTTMVDGVVVDTPSGVEIDYATGIGLENDVHMPGKYEGGGGNIEQLVFPTTLVYWLKWALGGYTFVKAEDGHPFPVNTHYIYGANERLLPSFTMEGGKDYFEHVFLGCSVDSLELTVSTDNGYVKLNPSITFAKDIKGELKEIDDFIFPYERPLMFYNMRFLFNGEDITDKKIIESFTLTINNNLQQNFGIGSRFSKANTTNGREVTWSIELKNDTDLTFLRSFWGGGDEPDGEYGAEEIYIEVILYEKVIFGSGLSEEIKIELPRCILDSVTQQPSGREEFSNTVAGKAYADNAYIRDNSGNQIAITKTSIKATINNYYGSYEVIDDGDGGDQ